MRSCPLQIIPDPEDKLKYFNKLNEWRQFPHFLRSLKWRGRERRWIRRRNFRCRRPSVLLKQVQLTGEKNSFNLHLNAAKALGVGNTIRQKQCTTVNLNFLFRCLVKMIHTAVFCHFILSQLSRVLFSIFSSCSKDECAKESFFASADKWIMICDNFELVRCGFGCVCVDLARWSIPHKNKARNFLRFTFLIVIFLWHP